MENAGEGPALAIRATLWHRDGRNGRLVGPTIVAASRTAVFSVVLPDATARLPEGFAEAIRELDTGRDFRPYWLEILYLDIFGNGLRNEALFDPRGLGAWHVTTPGNEVTNAGRSASI